MTIKALAAKYVEFLISPLWEENIQFDSMDDVQIMNYSDFLVDTKGKKVKYIISFKLPKNGEMQKIKEIKMKLCY